MLTFYPVILAQEGKIASFGFCVGTMRDLA
jgi:hypothetical protein